MDVAYVNPFVTSTIDTFKTMLSLEVKPGQPQLRDEKNFSYDVSGIIGLSGEAQGSICLSFPKLMALKVVSKLLGAEIKIVGAEVADGIGEIANIVAGNAKQHLPGFNLSISLPKVVVGPGHYVASPKGVPTIVVPFVSVMGNFAMEVSLRTPDHKKQA
jgi:chemotaxis protein CheX